MTPETLYNPHYIFRYRAVTGNVTSDKYDTLDLAKAACDANLPKNISVVFYASTKMKDKPYHPIYIRVPELKKE